MDSHSHHLLLYLAILTLFLLPSVTSLVSVCEPQQHRITLLPSSKVRLSWVTLEPKCQTSQPEVICSHCSSWRTVEDCWSYQYRPWKGKLHYCDFEVVPDTLYSYKFPSSSFIFPPFKSHVSPSAKAKIVVFGDSGISVEARMVIKGIIEQEEVEERKEGGGGEARGEGEGRYDISVMLGDTSYADDEEEDLGWDIWGRLLQPLSSHLPFMVVAGNWDSKSKAAKAFLARNPMPVSSFRTSIKEPNNNVVKGRLKEYRTSRTNSLHHRLPKQQNPSSKKKKALTEFYYSFDVSDIHFTILNSQEPYTEGTDQYKWLEKDLKEADNNRATVPFLAVCAHHPLYSSNLRNGGPNLKLREAIEQLLVDYKVDLMLTGHDHGYERSFPLGRNGQLVTEGGGIKHLTIATGGAPFGHWNETKPSWSMTRSLSYGFSVFHSDPSSHSLRIQFVQVKLSSLDHDFQDSFTIFPNSLHPVKGEGAKGGFRDGAAAVVVVAAAEGEEQEEEEEEEVQEGDEVEGDEATYVPLAVILFCFVGWAYYSLSHKHSSHQRKR